MISAENFGLILAIVGVSVYLYLNAEDGDATSFNKLGSVTVRKSSLLRRDPNGGGRECTIYVAPSSLKGNPGFGLYTTRDLWKGETFLGGPDGLAIPIEAYEQRNIPKGRLKKQWIDLWNPYWWGRGVPDHVAFEAGPDFVDYQIGFGFLPNHHCIIPSVASRYPDHYPYDDTIVNRFESPGAGAFSYNMGREFIAARAVKAGEELFMDYGYCQHEQNPGWTNDMYMPLEFQEASLIIWDRIGPYAIDSFEFDESGNVVLDEVEIQDTDQIKAHLVKELLPANKEEVDALETNPLLSLNKLPIHLAQTKGLQHRTTDWIRQNGMCVETIAAGKSTLPDAGQGAFAQHLIKKGELATIAPLLHIMDQDVLAIYDKKGEHQIGTQLLLNYCFSNPNSTVLLCPTTNAVLINHCSNRTKQCGPKGPNVDYRWSSGWDKTSDEWRQQSLEELEKKSFRGLSFEIYALHDVQPGDEVFMDYGIEWEQAWEKHVKNWKPPPRQVKGEWITAKEANEKGGPILQSLMLDYANVFDDVNHPYLMTGCVYGVSIEDKHRFYQEKNPDWRSWDAQKVLETYADDGSRFHYQEDSGYSHHYDGTHWPCSVLWKDDDGTYVVKIHPHPKYPPMPWAKNEVPRILFHYPRDSIHYFVKPYASDQHLPGVFRHPIGLRDDVFPKQWMNKKE